MIFHSYVSHYQRVSLSTGCFTRCAAGRPTQFNKTKSSERAAPAACASQVMRSWRKTREPEGPGRCKKNINWKKKTEKTCENSGKIYMWKWSCNIHLMVGFPLPCQWCSQKMPKRRYECTFIDWQGGNGSIYDQMIEAPNVHRQFDTGPEIRASCFAFEFFGVMQLSQSFFAGTLHEPCSNTSRNNLK